MHNGAAAPRRAAAPRDSTPAEWLGQFSFGTWSILHCLTFRHDPWFGWFARDQDRPDEPVVEHRGETASD